MSEQDKGRPQACCIGGSEVRCQASAAAAGRPDTDRAPTLRQGRRHEDGRSGARVAVDAIPTGALSLDLALGSAACRAVASIEIFGPKSSGKTTLVYQHYLRKPRSLAACARSWTPSTRWTRCTRNGSASDIDELLVSQPDYGEQALEIVDMLMRSGAVDVIAVDSVAALVRAAR